MVGGDTKKMSSYSKKCKYECLQDIFWDKEQNKFREVLSREIHTPDRCKAFKSGQLYISKTPERVEQQQEQQDILSSNIQVKLDQLGQYIKTGFENLQRELQLLAEKYPELKELSELKTENAQLRQVIGNDPNLVKRANEIFNEARKSRVEERITEYKEVENLGNED